MRAPLLRAGIFALALVRASASDASLASPGFTLSTQDTVKVAEREDHSPFLTANSSGFPALVWVATAPDTNAAGRFDEVAYAERDSSGWTAPSIVGGPAAAIFTPELAFDANGGRWIVWSEHDGTDSKIRLRRDYSDSTWTFTLDDPSQPDIEPSICADDSGGVVVVWQGWRGTNYEILMSTGNASGFSPPQVISEAPTSDREPEVVWGSGKAWIVWSSYRDPAYNLISRRYEGTTLTPPVSLTTSYRARNLHPQIAWDSTNGVLWVAFLWVNQGWEGFNQHEFPGLYDMGSPRLRAYDGTQIFLPAGLNGAQQYPRSGMEGLGYTRFNYGGTPTPDRTGEGLGVVALPGGRVEVLHKQNGMLPELDVANFYWSVTGTRYGGGVWSSPGEFLELRTSFAWEEPAVVVTGDSLRIAWSADHRVPAISAGLDNPNLFGHDANIVVRSVALDTSPAGPLGLVSLGAASSPPPVVAAPRPQFTVNDSGEVRTLLWGDNHRHSVDLSWDAYVDAGFKQTVFYSLDWLGHDFLCTSDHAERYSKAVWASVARWAMIYDVPSRFRVFPGYERSMRGGAGGDQNALYRDPAEFTEASAGYPAIGDWDVMYAAMSGKDVISVPNQMAQCGAITNWSDLANGNPSALPAPLRLVEVYQALRKSFEYPGCPDQTSFCTVGPDSGWVNVMLALGLRIGLICASDHTIVAGYSGVLSKSMSREDIFDALRDRRCFGASKNGRMNLDFRVAGELMGSETATSLPPTLFMHVESTSPLSNLEVNKNGNPSWFSASSAAAETTITFTDTDANAVGTTSYYYLRARDASGRMAYSSPVWVTHNEPSVGAQTHVQSEAIECLSIEGSPNPSGGGAIRLALRGVGTSGGIVRIHDIAGRLVRELPLSAGEAGERALDWDSRDERGAAVSPGVYYAVVQSNGLTRAVKLVVVR